MSHGGPPASGSRRRQAARPVWAPRPWWARLAAGNAVPPPGVLPGACSIAAVACLAPGLQWRLVAGAAAGIGGLAWVLAATAWVRVSHRGLLWRQLGSIRHLPWSQVAGCAAVWVEQGRKHVRVVGVETADGELVLLWPTAWTGEARRQQVVATCRRYRSNWLAGAER